MMRPRWLSTAKWVFAVLLFLDMIALLFVLSLANATAEGPAKRTLRQSIAILTEVDTFLDGHYESLRVEAARTEEPSIALPDFPVAVSFAPDEVQQLSRDELRALLLDRAATLVYDDGSAVLKDDRGAEVSFFSPQGAIRSGMDFLRPTPHRALNIATIVLASIAGLAAAGLAASTRGYGKLLGIGAPVFLAAVPFLITAVAVRFAFRLAADGVDEYLVVQYLQLAQELTWAPIRNGMIISVGSAAVTLSGVALARWNDTRPAGP
jgi:hypothetical protein